jgi:biopolymer transport protein ExbD
MSVSVSEARSLIRKAKRRVPEGEEISHLNLTAMMDMMTILLVFMIKSMATSASPLNIPVALPESTTRLPTPEDAKIVTISKTAILVEGAPIVGVKTIGNTLDIDPADKKQGAFGMEIGKLTTVLSQHHEHLYVLAGRNKEKVQHELTIVADKDVPYRLLYAVMYSAGQAKATSDPNGPGFLKYRLFVLREAK